MTNKINKITKIFAFLSGLCEFTVKTTEDTVKSSYEISDFTCKFLTVRMNPSFWSA
jgi:hypothetical protein